MIKVRYDFGTGGYEWCRWGITILQGLHNGGSHVADQFKTGETSSLNNNNNKYIYHALINALSAHMIHMNLNMKFYTHVEHSPRLPKQFT